MRIILIIIGIAFQVALSGQVSIIKKDVTCKGRNNGTMEAVIEGIDGPFTYAWSNGAKSKKVTGLKPGDYSVTVSVNGVQCFSSKAGRIYDGPEFTVSISAKLLAVTPQPLPCGTKPDFHYQLTATPHGGKPPYYCSWGRLDGEEGACVIEVSGKSIRANVFMSDSSGCGDSEVWEKKGATKLCPKDPNDIAGNEGYGTERWVSVNDELDYTVRFENDPIFATSSAASVLVTVPIDDDVDPFSFRLNSMGFGNKIIEIPEEMAFYQKRHDYSADIGYWVDVTAGLDLPNQRFFWLFETIDPATGQPPIDPTAGFLPVNDTLTGSGEGFINFICRPKSTTPTGEIVSHQASIIFDLNESIETNIWDNKVDAFPPSTNSSPLPDTFYSNVIPFDWIIEDDPGGCGVQHAQIFISTNRIEFESNGFIADTTESSLQLNWGTMYYYLVLGTDNVGNREDGEIDSFYIIPQRSIDFITPDEDHYCITDTLWIDVQLVTLPNADLYISRDSGMTYMVLEENVDMWPYALVLDSTHVHPSLFLKARNEAFGIEQISDPFTVKYLPVVDAGDPVIGCDNEIMFVEAEGTNTYLWWPDEIIGDITGRYSNVYADESQYAYVEGTDVFGCSAVDSVFITVHPHSVDTVGQPLCEGDSVWIDNVWIAEEGFYTTTYGNTFGCDSIIVTNVFFDTPCIWAGGPFVYVDTDAIGDNNGTSWEDAFTDLQDALYVARRYENVQEIWVAEGVYTPHTTSRDSSFVLSDSIKIFGGFIGIEETREERTADAELVVLSGDINTPDTLSDNSYHTIGIASSCVECILDGLTVTYGFADNPMNSNDIGAGVLNYGKATITNVIFERNYATEMGSALYSSDMSAHLILQSCIFRLNTSSLGRDVMNVNGSVIEFGTGNSMY